MWSGPLRPDETPVESVEAYAALSIFEIPAVPDFSAKRFGDLEKLDAVQRVRRVGERQSKFLAALHALGPDTAVSLRYVYRADDARRIRMFLIGRAAAPTPTAAMARIRDFDATVAAAFPGEYYSCTQLDADNPAQVGDVLDLRGVVSMCEVLKIEERIPAWHDPRVCGFSSYYVLGQFAAADNDMVEFCRALVHDAGRSAVTVDVCLVPTVPLNDIERAEIDHWIKRCEQWGRDQRKDVGGLFSRTTFEVTADPRAQDIGRTYRELLQRYAAPDARCFVYAIRCLWAEDEPPTDVARALAAFAVLPDRAPRFIEVGRGHPAFERAVRAARWCYVTPQVCHEEIWQDTDRPETLRRLHRLADIKDISGFFRLPIPGREGCPGVRLDGGLPEAVSPAREATPPATTIIGLGHFVEDRRPSREQASFQLEHLTKHCLIVGSPGSGKTTLCFSLLDQLWTAHRVPFIVLEPAKTEYRALAGPVDDLLVFTIGDESTSPFRLNPLEILDGVKVSEHIGSVLGSFTGAFGLWGPLPSLLEEALREVYADRGWSEYGAGGDDPALEPPTLDALYWKVQDVAARKSYRGDFAANVRGALETRLASLVRGPKGRCFNTRRSLPADVLMERPVVIELDRLNDAEKSLAAMLIVTLVREYAKSAPTVAARRRQQKLGHLILVEEAHTLIGGAVTPASPEQGNPQDVAVRAFVRMLAEMRALGVGIAIADQSPTALAPDVIKNTNIKVMHRLVALEDRKHLGDAMVFDEGQRELAATLEPGLSLAFMEGWPRSRLIREPNYKEQRDVSDVPDDRDVAVRMAAVRAREGLDEAFMPFARCGDVCHRCDDRVREDSERRVEVVLRGFSRSTPEMVTQQYFSTVPAAFDVSVGMTIRDWRDPARAKAAVRQAVNDMPAGSAADAADVRSHCARVHFVERVAPRLQNRSSRER